MTASHISIIGGGIIGLCCAYYLQQEGFSVTVIDQGDLKKGCSYINAGMVVPSHIIPLAAPGVIKKGFRWMFRSDSPFAIHPHLNRDMLRWLWIFNHSATPQNVTSAIPYLRDINNLSKSLYRELSEDTGFDFGFKSNGLLMLYQDARLEKEEIKIARRANKSGVRATILSAREIQQLEPELTLSVRGGIYYPGDAHLNPGKFMQNMICHLKTNGATLLENTKVTGFKKENKTIKAITTNKGTFSCDEVIIACGAWSGSLLSDLGITLPVQGGKGYSFTIENMMKNIRIPAILTDGKVAVTPMGNSLRVGGTMEIGNTLGTINRKRVKGILNTLYEFYPELKDIQVFSSAVSEGLRPCSPDGLPYIGRWKGLTNITIATGHGMMGMSLGPATGKLVSECISKRETSMPLHAFDPGRYQSNKGNRY